jgi:hypothetical protein
MPPRDFRLPDDFPDLTLPEKAEPAPAAPAQRFPEPARRVAHVSQAPSPWKVGDRVLAPWEPDRLYAGKVAQIQDDQALIQFEDGDAGWVRLDQIRALTVQRGQKVFSRRRMGPHFFPAEILEVRGDEVCVRFEDGQGEEWTRVAALRVPCQATGPGASPTRVASHLAFFDNLRPGDRVWAPWASATLYAGTVDRVEGREVHIHFDDGDRGWVLLEQILPLQIPLGLRVLGRWKMGGQYYPGTVTEVRGEQIHIQYDDGDREWTRPAALLLPCDPFGPDARPSKVVSHAGGAALAWILPVAIAVGLLFLRVGCR